MSATTLANVNFQSEIFAITAQAAFTNRLELLASGAMAQIPENIVSSNTTGYTVAIPRWNALTGDSVQITSSLSTTINAATDIKDIAAWVEREKAWGAMQLVNSVGGKDATIEIARMLGEYWANELHTSMIKTLTGVTASALSSTHVYDATGTNDKLISKENVLRAKGKLGDYASELSLAIMNSAIHNDAVRAQLVTDGGYTDTISQTGKIDMILGSRVFQTDKLSATAGVYPTYFAAPGALAYKFRNRAKNSVSNAQMYTISAGGLIIDVELYRNATANGGEDYIISRTSFLTHVPGVQFDGTVTSNPTNAELATGTTWTKVQTDDKLIPVVQLLTNTTTLA